MSQACWTIEPFFNSTALNLQSSELEFHRTHLGEYWPNHTTATLWWPSAALTAFHPRWHLPRCQSFLKVNLSSSHPQPALSPVLIPLSPGFPQQASSPRSWAIVGQQGREESPVPSHSRCPHSGQHPEDTAYLKTGGPLDSDLTFPCFPPLQFIPTPQHMLGMFWTWEGLY